MINPLIIAGGLAAKKFVDNMSQADRNEEQARVTSVKAANRLSAAQAKERASNKEFEDSKNRIVNRKSAVLKTSFPKFVSVYKKIARIEFNSKTAGIEELLPKSKLEDFNKYMGDYLGFNPPVLSEKQLLAGFLVEGAKGLLPLGGGFVVSGITGLIIKDSEALLTAAHAQKKHAALYEEAVDSKVLAIESVCFYMDKISEIVAKFNALFLKSIRSTEQIIDKNGYNGNNYTDAEMEKIGICLDLAMALKKIIDTPIIDNQNQITVAAKTLLDTSEQCMRSFKDFV